MRLSEKILNKDFEEVKIGIVGGKNGYLAKEVDSHLQNVALEAEKLEKHNDTLTRQLDMIEKSKKNATDIQLDKVMSMEDVLTKEVELEEQAKQLTEMRESFERIMLVAQKEAGQILDKARKDAAEIYNDAQKNAKLIVDKAREIEHESEEKIKESVNSANLELRKISDKYDDIRGRLMNVYDAIGSEVDKMSDAERQVG